MVPEFRGFPPAGLTFLRQLKKNNNREWFASRKDIYEEQVRKPMEDFVETLNATALARFAADYVTDSRKAIYRIYRDTRFSKDKTPYKTHAGALFVKRGLPKHGAAAFYVGISPEEVEVAGGVYMPGPEEIRLLRSHLAENAGEIKRLYGATRLRKLMGEIQGESLVRTPKGFDESHPAAEWIRRKQWYFYKTLAPSLATTPKLVKEVAARFEAMTPLVNFFNRAFPPARPGAEQRMAAGAVRRPGRA